MIRYGIRNAFSKFNEYQFAKYNRDGEVKLRDAMFLTRPEPLSEDRKILYKKIAENEWISQKRGSDEINWKDDMA